MRSLFLLCLFALTATAQVPPEKAISTFKVADGLQVELFAAEPMVINPTNMDIDPLGRVWITEAVNYRNKLRGKPLNRPEGDRIVILTDKDGDGKADTSTVFYQGPELYGPLGICIVPFPIDDKASGGRKPPVSTANDKANTENASTSSTDNSATGREKQGADAPRSPSAKIGYRVLVSQSPDILEFWDRDGDGKADGPPAKFLSGFGGVDHDHGVHAIQVGPDGKFYFTVGDQGVKDLQSKDGKGRKWTSNSTDCRAGTIWRCDPDGTHLELIAHNFRNEYEACVDSFGEIWCSDNDDDGNQQTRICYVMPGGNYGYHPRGKGESHWHQEQPGVVPNVLRTGFGSPCGITCYEGTLLPEKYRGHLLHVDAGPREVRCFHKKPKGAGYELDKTLMLTSTDTWFRPSDVTVAPDGSVFVCDWYDPGVGGHGMGDTTRGRVYRITPAGHKGYNATNENISDAGILLNSPSLATRALAWSSPAEQRKASINKIKYRNVENPALLARIIWIAAHDTHSSSEEKNATDSFLSIGMGLPVGIRPAIIPALMRCNQVYLGDKLESKHFIKSVPIRAELGGAGLQRESLIHYRLLPSSPALIASINALAKLYDGKDRFYLAALNIACGSDPERRDKILADFDKHFPEWNDTVAELVFELRPKCMMAKLDTLLKDPKLTAAQKGRIVDILAVSEDKDAGRSVLALLAGDHPAEVKAKALDNLKTFLPTKWKHLAGKEIEASISALMQSGDTARFGLQLIAATNAVRWVDEVRILSKDLKPGTPLRLEAIQTLGKLVDVKAVDGLIAMAFPENADTEACLVALGQHLPKDRQFLAGELEASDFLKTTVRDMKASAAARLGAASALAGTKAGSDYLISLHEKQQLPSDIVAGTGILLRNSPYRGVPEKAKTLFPATAKMDLSKLPSPAALAKTSGDRDNGRRVYLASFKGEAQCMKCHKVKGEGGEIGPDLSVIGKKASKENLFESILNPSKAIADQYASWKVDTDDGASITGLLVKETPTEWTVRDANGKDTVVPAKGATKKKSEKSLMPDDIAKSLTEQELIDLVEYLYGLKD